MEISNTRIACMILASAALLGSEAIANINFSHSADVTLGLALGGATGLIASWSTKETWTKHKAVMIPVSLTMLLGAFFIGGNALDLPYSAKLALAGGAFLSSGTACYQMAKSVRCHHVAKGIIHATIAAVAFLVISTFQEYCPFDSTLGDILKISTLAYFIAAIADAIILERQQEQFLIKP